MDNPGEITSLLAKVRKGEKHAENRLADLLMPELQRMASRILSREYRGNTMETGDLVNEIWLKASSTLKTFKDRTHFKAYVAWKMHKILIDRARKIITREKHLGRRADTEDTQLVARGAGDALVEQAMQRIAIGKVTEDPRAVQVVILKSGGLTYEEIAEDLGVSVSTVKRDWRAARAYLADRIPS
jgi:RNA polymerase sigma factor (TIGR02999 family)